MDTAEAASLEKLLFTFLWKDQRDLPILAIHVPDPSASAQFAADWATQSGLSVSLHLLSDRRPFPYGPLVEEMFENLRRASRAEVGDLFRRARVYPRHRALLQRQLDHALPPPSEGILRQEVDFERGELLRALVQMFFFSRCHAQRLFIFADAQRLPRSALDFLRTILGTRNRPAHLRILLFYCLQHEELWRRSRDAFTRFLSVLEERQGIFHLGGGTKHSSLDSPSPQASLETAERFYELLALDDALEHYRTLLYAHEIAASPLSSEELDRVLFRLGTLHHWRGEHDLALSFWQRALGLAQEHRRTDSVCILLTALCSAFLEKNELEHALQLAHQAASLARQLGDRVALFESRFLEFLIQDRLRTQTVEEFRQFYEELLVEAKTLGWLNHLAYIATNPYALFTDFTDEYEAYLFQGIALSKAQKNTFRLAQAYQSAALVASVKGRYAEALAWYQKSLKLKKRLRNPLEMAYILNGMGFYRLMVGRYQSAQRFFRKAMHHLRQARDFHEVGMTLFNLAVSSLLRNQPAEAAEYVQRCLKLLSVLHLQQLSYHSRFGILTLYAVSLALSGQNAKAWTVLLQIENRKLKPYPKKNEEYFLWHFLKALLNSDPAEWDTAEFYLYQPNDDIQFFAPFFYYHRSRHYRDFHQESAKAAEYWERCREAALKSNNEFYLNLTQAEAPPTSTQPEREGPRRHRKALSWILPSARSQRRLLELHRRLDEIRFLNTFQSVTLRTSSCEELFERCGELLFQTSGMTLVCILQLGGGGPRPVFLRGPATDFASRYFAELQSELFSSMRKVFLHPPLPPEGRLPPEWEGCGLWHSRILQTADGDHHLLCLFQRSHPRQGFLSFLQAIAAHLEVAAVRLVQHQTIQRQVAELERKNLLLEKTATTDSLTMVGNRQALLTALKLEIGRVNRFRGKPLSVLFLDLDNFKFFNDTWGHAIGDALLVQSARLLQEAVRSTDLVFRYGGDEFVVILPETDHHGAREVAARILDRMHAAGSFATLIEEQVGRPISVPADKRLGCSIGVATYDGLDQTLSDPLALLVLADNALYRAKNSGKNCVI